MRAVVLILGGTACLALAAPGSPRLMWNATASVPIGFYQLSPPGTPAIHDLVVVAPDPKLAALLARGGWLPRGVPLIKPVAAIAGQTVCRQGQEITIDGRRAATALSVDGRSRALPRWSGCRTLRTDELLVLAPAFGSFDGRYFGPTQHAAVKALARPIWIPQGAVSIEPRR